MQILRARSEHADPSAFRFDHRVGFIVRTIDEHKSAAGEVAFVTIQVEQRCVVERLVGLLVDVRMPILIVQRLGRSIGDAGKEGRIGEVNGVEVDLEFLADRLGYALLYILMD